jgi:outer membrane lipoprotein-sorting protein
MKVNFKRLLSATVGIVVVLSAGSTAAADIDQIIQKIQTKRNRFERQIQDITLKQSLETHAEEAGPDMRSVVMIRGDQFRSETVMADSQGAGMKTILLSDGQNAWMVSPFTGKRKMAPEDAARLRSGAYWWEEMIADGRVAGEDRVDGRPCVAIEFKESEQVERLCLDRERLVPLRAEVRDRAGRGVELLFSDYRDVGAGYLVPFQVDSRIDGRLFSTTRVTEVEVNTGLGDQWFDPDRLETE